MIIKEEEMNADRIIEVCREMIVETINRGEKIFGIRMGMKIYKTLVDDYKKKVMYCGAKEETLTMLFGYQIETYIWRDLEDVIDIAIDYGKK